MLFRSAREAREIVAPGWRHGAPATDPIRRRAKLGELEARASVYVSIRSGIATKEHDHPIPKEFWSGHPFEENWSAGDFSTSTYVDGEYTTCEALGVTFERAGIQGMASRDTPASVVTSTIAVQSTANAERECESWLRQQFLADPERKMAKKSFEEPALEKFGGRLSQAGFRRVWAKLAPSEGRNRPGRKS